MLKQRFDEMDCLIHQRAGWEPKHFFDKDELQSTGIDSPTFAELNKTYGYDKALNTTATKDKQEQLTFTLNKNNQITQVHNQHREQEQYRYDQNGYLAQRTVGFEDIAQHISHDEIYQKGNKLNRINDDNYRYDNAGRLLEKTEIQNGFRQKTTYYRWNASNQLIGITTHRGEVWYYKYDGLGRRIAKECPQRDLKIEYLWDGDQLAYTQTFKNDELQSRRHCIFNGWQLLAQQDWYSELEQNHNGNIIHQRAETSYAITQPNGKVLALLSPEGKSRWKDEPKSIWGLRLNSLFRYSKLSPFDPQMLYAGQWLDEESGLAYNRFRYYDPTTANYLCADPIGLRGGGLLFFYVQNPWDFVDPFGLSSCELAKAMEKAGTPRPINSAAHHIVPETAELAKPARDVLNKYGLLNSAENGVFLPNKNNTDSLQGILHNGRHPNEYIEEVNKRIIDADNFGGKQEVIEELKNIKNILTNANRNSDWRSIL